MEPRTINVSRDPIRVHVVANGRFTAAITHFAPNGVSVTEIGAIAGLPHAPSEGNTHYVGNTAALLSIPSSQRNISRVDVGNNVVRSVTVDIDLGGEKGVMDLHGHADEPLQLGAINVDGAEVMAERVRLLGDWSITNVAGVKRTEIKLSTVSRGHAPVQISLRDDVHFELHAFNEFGSGRLMIDVADGDLATKSIEIWDTDYVLKVGDELTYVDAQPSPHRPLARTMDDFILRRELPSPPTGEAAAG